METSPPARNANRPARRFPIDSHGSVRQPRLMKVGLVFGFALGALAAAQAFRPTLNEGSAAAGPEDVFRRHPAPAAVEAAVRAACYDCHSDHTRYPWYGKLQPVAWWVEHHIEEAKGELNFAQFGSYPSKRAAHKLRECIETVEEGEMPLASYRWMHPEARWTPEERTAFVSWAKATEQAIATSSASP